MSSTNLRNKPVDRRRLNAQDREQYRPQARQQALSKARARRGSLAWNNKVDVGRQEQKPGSGGLSLGRQTQQQRQREQTAELRRSEQLRNDRI